MSRLGILSNPIEIVRRTFHQREGDNLRHGIRMAFFHFFHQPSEAVSSCFQNHQRFLLLTYFPLPRENRRNRREDIRAGGQFFFDKGPPDLFSFFFGRGGDKNDNFIHRRMQFGRVMKPKTVLSVRVLYCAATSFVPL